MGKCHCNTGRRIGMFFLFLAVFAAASAVVMLLWNAIIPDVIGWSAMGYWQALGLMVLTRILLGGLGYQFRHGHNRRHGHHGPDHFTQMHGKMKGMSRKERRAYICKCMSGEIDPEREQTEKPENE